MGRTAIGDTKMKTTFRKALLGSGAAIVALALATGAMAQQRTFDIPAQDAATAIGQFGLQAGVQITAPADALRGVRTPAVRGDLDARVALQRLLEGTSLVVARDDGRTIVLQRRPRDRQADTDSAGDQTTSLEDIVVTGTRLRGAGNRALPVDTYTREAIDASGQPSVATFLSTLSEVSTSINDSGFSGGGTNRQSGVQLRGLPAGTTLVLLNGRRVEPGAISTSASVVDLNQIPIAAVERIEVLPFGSSAVYGGDALAGVVNVILKDRMDGIAVDFRYGFADGTDDTLVSFAGGRVFERGSFLLLGQWNQTNALMNTQRDFFSTGDYRPYGGLDRRTRLCSPGTVTSVMGNLPGLGSSFAAIPQTPSGNTPTLAEFAATAGQQNLCEPNGTGGGNALIPQRDTYALHAAGSFALTSRIKAFAELTYNRADVLSPAPSPALNNILVPASNAFNPFGEAVRVTTRLSPDYLPSGNYREAEFTRAVFGVRGDIGRDWDFEISAMHSGDATDSWGLNQTVNAAARTAALASSDPATALNPFTAGRPASDAVLSTIFTDTRSDASGNRTLFSGVVRGPLLELPAGPVDIAVGGERLRENLDYGFTGGRLIEKRSSTSAFVEARIPLLSASDEQGGVYDRLAVTVAGRLDDYSDIGEATTKQAGLEFRPSQTALVRAVFATSFKPPALLQTGLPAATFESQLWGLTDPLRGGELVIGGTVVSGPNPNLVPETGEGRVIGFEWMPSFAEGLRLSVNAWDLDLENYIIRLFPQTFINNEALFPGYVLRGPTVGGLPGPILEVPSTFVNYGRLEVAGLDYDVSYDWDTSLGQARLGLSASQVKRFDVEIVPGAPIQSRLGRHNAEAWAPEWKGALSLALSNPRWSVGLTGRYLGRYQDPGSADGDRGDIWTLDATGSIGLDQLSRVAGANGARLTFGLVNITNEYPEFVSSFPYYDVTQGSWRGRYASIRLSLDW